MTFGGANRKVQEIKQTALTFPADNLFLQVDGMDNKKSYLPRKAVNTLIDLHIISKKICPAIILDIIWIPSIDAILLQHAIYKAINQIIK